MVLDKAGRPTRGQLADTLDAVITERKIDIVTINPFAIRLRKTPTAHRRCGAGADRPGAKHNISIDVRQHISKGSSDPGNASRGRGASAVKDGGRLIYTLTPMSVEKAQIFGVAEEQRRLLIRMDSAKVNITKPLGAAKWFRLIGVKLSNANELYPNGDEVQTVESWTPPDTWADLGVHLLNKILTAIDDGLPDGSRYTDAPRADDRAAWRVIVKHAPTKTEGQAREVIKTWVKNGVLVRHEYDNPTTRKPGQRTAGGPR